mgnify:CR=1 FL=1
MMPCITSRAENDQLYTCTKNLKEEHSHAGWLNYLLGKTTAEKFKYGDNCESTFGWFNEGEPNHGNGVEEHAALVTSDWLTGPQGKSTRGWNNLFESYYQEEDEE